MKTDYISEIIHCYFADDYPPEMQEKLQAWLVSEEKASLKEKALLGLWSELKVNNDESVYASLQKVKQKLGLGLNKEKTSAPTNRKCPHKRITILSIVAISFLCLMGGWWSYFSTRTEWVNITTAYGERTQCLLPDSSLVWINAGSTLSYPSEFKGDSRLVRLSGEAWFAVTKDRKKPFIVQTTTCNIKVLGTEFNVSDYKENRRVIVQLEKGKVEVTRGRQEKHLLAPNQQLIMDKTDHTTRITPISILSSDWKEGKLVFENAPLPDILQTLKRHYNTALVYKDFQPSTDRYSICFKKEETLEQTLDLLKELTENFTWSKNNNQIILQSWHK